MNSSFLLNKIYYRQNMYVQNAQLCDAKEEKILLPVTILTGIATIAGFLVSSPIAETHPKILSAFSTVPRQVEGTPRSLQPAFPPSRLPTLRSAPCRTPFLHTPVLTLPPFVHNTLQVLSILAMRLTAYRNRMKYGYKAELFRTAAGDYRLMATQVH